MQQLLCTLPGLEAVGPVNEFFSINDLTPCGILKVFLFLTQYDMLAAEEI